MPEKKNYLDFLSRLPQIIDIYDLYGYNYARHILDVSITDKVDIKNRDLASYGFYIWSYMGISFLLLTYRSLKNMLDIIFMSDNQMINDRYYKSQKQREEEKQIEEKYGE